MPLETAIYFDTLQPDWPLGTDPESQGDDHIRMLKQVIQNTFPNVNGEISANPEQLNNITNGLTYTAADADAGTAARWDLTFPDDPATLAPLNVGANKGENAAATLGMIYPVGAIIINTGTNPADYLGFGTWTQRSGSVYGVGSVTDSGGLAWSIPLGAVTGNWRVQNSMIVAATITLSMDAVAAHTHGLSRTIAQNTSGSDYVGNDGGHPGVMSSSSPISSGGGHTPTGRVTIGSGAANTGSMMRSPGYAFYVWERTA